MASRDIHIIIPTITPDEVKSITEHKHMNTHMCHQHETPTCMHGCLYTFSSWINYSKLL